MARSRTLPPREIADKLNQIRQLIALAEAEIGRGIADLAVARTALAELETAVTP